MEAGLGGGGLGALPGRWVAVEARAGSGVIPCPMRRAIAALPQVRWTNASRGQATGPNNTR